MRELKHDPVEDTDLHKSVVAEVDKKARVCILDGKKLFHYRNKVILWGTNAER